MGGKCPIRDDGGQGGMMEGGRREADRFKRD
jgi:hypothetical protein